MTLHTRIAILDPVYIPALYNWVNENLLKVDDPELDVHGPDRWQNYSSYGNAPGQGFDAWFWIDYRENEPLNAHDIYYDEDFNETTEPVEWEHRDGTVRAHLAEPAAYCMVSFDTAYGYRSVEGYGCAVLHADYIVRLGNFLKDNNVRFKWLNEYAGTWHDSYEDLQGFMGDGDVATHWFENTGRHRGGAPCNGQACD